tara:strand:+ start:679 stop:789 length:111 start_codon:yes stop_codon:yes gene_type:complete
MAFVLIVGKIPTVTPQSYLIFLGFNLPKRDPAIPIE